MPWYWNDQAIWMIMLPVAGLLTGIHALPCEARYGRKAYDPETRNFVVTLAQPNSNVKGIALGIARGSRTLKLARTFVALLDNRHARVVIAK